MPLTDATANSQPSRRDLYIVIADQSDNTKNITDTLKKRFPSAGLITHAQVIHKKKSNIYITIGPAALRSLLMQSVEGIILSIFTSSHAVREIIGNISNTSQVKLTGIYADPSPADQLRLISAIYKRPIRVAVIVRNKDSYLTSPVLSSIAKSDTQLSINVIPLEESINRTLDRITGFNVLLAIPDREIYNSENIRNILITTYRRDQAVIGFSVPFVNAGALATTYSEINDIIDQLEEMLDDINNEGIIPDLQFPKYFTVMTNDNVARSLNIVIDDEVRKLQRKAVTK